jgi:hypothetical protein
VQAVGENQGSALSTSGCTSSNPEQLLQRVAIGNAVVATIAVPLANPPSGNTAVAYDKDTHARNTLKNLLCSLDREQSALRNRFIVFTADHFLLGRLPVLDISTLNIAALSYFAEASQGSAHAFQVSSFYLAKLAVTKAILQAGYNLAVLDQDTAVVANFTSALNQCDAGLRLTWWSPGTNNDHFFPGFDTAAFFMACAHPRTIRVIEAAMALAKNVSDQVISGAALGNIGCGNYTHQDYQALLNSTHTLWANKSYLVARTARVIDFFKWLSACTRGSKERIVFVLAP